MKNLARHIEILLMDNDCVVIPEFGGFIAHDLPAAWNKEEGTFTPPARVIGFNAKLKVNDRLLVQSFMRGLKLSYMEATAQLEYETEVMIETLHEQGKVILGNIGEILYSSEKTYSYIPYYNKMPAPKYYGLDSFEIKELADLRSEEKRDLMMERTRRVTRYILPVLKYGSVAAAAVLFFFFLSTPLENTNMPQGTEMANLMPTDIFNSIKKESVLTASVENPHTAAVGETKVGEVLNITPASQPEVGITQEVKAEAVKEKTPETVIVAREVKVNRDGGKTTTKPTAAKPAATKTAETPKKATVAQNGAPATTAATVQKTNKEKPFHLIVASVTSKAEAQKLVSNLQTQGYETAKMLQGNGRLRVSIGGYDSRKEASDRLNRLRETKSFKDAWLLVN